MSTRPTKADTPFPDYRRGERDPVSESGSQIEDSGTPTAIPRPYYGGPTGLHRTRFRKRKRKKENPQKGFLSLSLLFATVQFTMLGELHYAIAKCLMLLMPLSATVKQMTVSYTVSRASATAKTAAKPAATAPTAA
jgi:hypothetical protein